MRSSDERTKRMITRDVARESFLYTIHKDFRFVLEDLESSVFPLVDLVGPSLDIARSMSDFDVVEQLSEMAKSSEVEFQCASETFLGDPGEHAILRRALLLWGRKHRLVDVWLIREALSTLERWKRIGVNNDWAYSLSPKTFYKNREGLWPFTFEPWNPQLEVERSYKARVKEAFEDSLRSYLLEMRSKSQRFKAAKKNESDHFRWLIKYQICGMTYAEICKEYRQGKELARISEAIKPLARLIGLTLRSSLNF